MDKSITIDQLKALNIIARRRNPDYSFRRDTQFLSTGIYLKESLNLCQCLICKNKFELSEDAIIDHAIAHLKEFNLLAFT